MKKYFKKILSTEQLKRKIFSEKKKNNKIVQCHGVFDLIHVGHIKYFQAAKREGDFLVVSLTSDKYVNKGPGRPAFNQDFRAEVISSLEVVDAVYINNSPTAVNLINIIRPHIYFKGPDYKNTKKDKTGNILKEIKATQKFGGKVFYSNDVSFSSSNLINNYYNAFNSEQKNYLKKISKKYSFDFISKKVDSLKKLKVLLIGETIIDQYIFGEVLGKSGKEPHLVIKEEIKEEYLGGAAAIANHLSSFCNSINFLTIIGNKKDYFSFIKKSLMKNIKAKFFYKANSPTILKKRFIDKVTQNKVLGVYAINDEKIQKNLESQLQKNISKISSKTDLILISDYDHGFISKKIAKIILSQRKFVSLNAQINASNHGYHSLRKYKKIDTLIINENELRHETRDKNSNVEKLSYILMKNFNIKNLIITRGSVGAIMIRKNSKPVYCPAFAGKVVDKVGAGDAMLAIISLCLKMNFPNDLALFIGSLAGASAVETIGNSKFINRDQLLRQIEFLIK